LHELRAYRCAEVALSEVAGHHAAEPTPVPDEERVVQAVLVAQVREAIGSNEATARENTSSELASSTRIDERIRRIVKKNTAAPYADAV
jgi:hypothetical protein